MLAHVNRGPDSRTHSVERIECKLCDGRGEISDERAALIETGRALRNIRIAQRETLIEAAARLGMGPAQLSSIECGTAPIADYEPFK